ncbi:unnamed protein product [Schistosoma mattheei]|uniref:Uncharacterized protein n=1 Tax=Schistosoma mattheei TaxID=31246 RepID=A0A3P8DUQ2_9TREM|nr:unnamed protein product [Schistosoma mattheei]
MENIYQLSPVVEQIFVDGNSLNDFPVAVVVPNIKELTKRIVAKANLNDPLLLNGNKEETEVSKYNFNDSIPIVDTSTLCSQPAARKIVVSELENLGRKRGLKGFEIVRFLKQFFSEVLVFCSFDTSVKFLCIVLYSGCFSY